MTSIDTTPAGIAGFKTTGASPRQPKTAAIDIVSATPGNLAAKPKTPASKSAAVIKLLSRTKGATVDELMAETSWQAHSVRAFFTGLRKKGHALVREQRKDGSTCYRIAAGAVEATTTAPQPIAVSHSPEGTNAAGAAA